MLSPLSAMLYNLYAICGVACCHVRTRHEIFTEYGKCFRAMKRRKDIAFETERMGVA